LIFLSLNSCTSPNPQPQSTGIDFIFRVCYGSSSSANDVLRRTSLSLTNKLMSDKRKAGALFVKLVSMLKLIFSMWKKKTKTLITNQTKHECWKFVHRVNHHHVHFKEEKDEVTKFVSNLPIVSFYFCSSY